ncbi:MAG: MFS transporter [Bradyrhizobium sp.]|uniref:MFS transporter n=1 Tax=Bradyrhizobium sp. TaxID=376 RepID=UPI00239B2625|nr:MFS transporter [Bradyrhizobium sp.]MDE2603500.1 MFS transporter [Bradyrhizobium sp.]
MSSAITVGAGDLLTQRSFLLFLWSRSLSRFSSLIGVVAFGWQVYDLTGSAFALGILGLVGFIPGALLVFAAGNAADRYERKRILQACQFAEAATSLLLAWGAYAGSLTVVDIFIAVLVLGTTAAFENPATAALLPLVVPQGAIQRATALSSGAAQLATIAGPALGGVAYAVAPALPYGIMVAFWLTAAICAGAVRLVQPPAPKTASTPGDLFAGIRFIRDNPAILGTLSLDLFAVLFGGVAALLPIYARDILQTGPWGLGVLRAAPAVGALLTTVVLARQPIERRAGMRMFQAVIIFGVGTVVFSLSHWMWLSLLSLAVLGAADTVSVVIRLSLVQLATPDAMRGRVGAVNFLFINASNQLGQFESGVTAALLGTVPAAVFGGVATIAIALLWMKLFPTLRDVEKLE